jgi:8-oxo-dGTP pyrophosphatase MutT (NUDIX family)
MFDPSQPGSEPRLAASVILARPRVGTGEIEFLLLERHRQASFMSRAHVYPGGASDAGEDDPRLTAVRELFEEAGVLLCKEAVPAPLLASCRRELLAGKRFDRLLAAAGLTLDLEALHYFAHWITPSAERKRFSARFYLAALPDGQEATVDQRETTAAVWVTAEEALAGAARLRLLPPQVRTFHDLQLPARGGMAGLRQAAAGRARHPFAVLPRLLPQPDGFALLLPWDPEYVTAGIGESLEMPAGHPLATGPSRFVRDEDAWKHVYAPG